MAYCAKYFHFTPTTGTQQGCQFYFAWDENPLSYALDYTREKTVMAGVYIPHIQKFHLDRIYLIQAFPPTLRENLDHV